MIIQFLGLVLFMLLIVAFVAYFQGGIPISDPAKLASFHIQPDLLSNLNDSTGAKVSGRTASDNGTHAGTHARTHARTHATDSARKERRFRS